MTLSQIMVYCINGPYIVGRPWRLRSDATLHTEQLCIDELCTEHANVRPISQYIIPKLDLNILRH